MKKAISIVCLFVLTVALAVAVVSAADTSTSWTGWISDSLCGAKGANAGHKECAVTCVKQKGASYVFVNDKDKKVIAIQNQDAINADKDLGVEVTVTGTLNQDGSLHVNSIAPTPTGSM
ncbi:MAG: hypothetical protein ACLP1Y_09795 [Candidatus Acidiferrales bacterium]